MKRKKAQSHVNHERWLVSYADFITLLFAFFVVMFASTQADKTKAKAVSEAVREALEHGQFSTAISTVLGRGKYIAADRNWKQARPDAKENQPPPPAPPGPPPPGAHPADLVQSLNTLQKGLEMELKSGKVQLRLEARGLVVSLREAAFFGSGDDKVQTAGLPIVEKIAVVIRDVPNPIRLEGYTDSIPIHNSRFRSNWELSSARSIAMLEFLNQQCHIDRARLSVAGYAENAPADTNDTQEGRAHNRRVDVVVLSAEGVKSEPQAAAPAAAAASPGRNGSTAH